jgi:hypothetical protein
LAGVGGCDDGATSFSSGSGAGGAGTGGGGDAASTTTGSGGHDGGAAGSASSGGSGGSAAGAGVVRCDGAACLVPDNQCCEADDGTEECLPISSDCAGLRRSCDEAADCPASEICCTLPAAAPFFVFSTGCAASCEEDIAYQICSTDGECANGLGCVSQTCQGKTVKSCGPIEPSQC